MEEAWKKYVEKHGGFKGYAHFDIRVGLQQEAVQRYVLDPKKVAQHSFYPFIQYVKSQTKVYKSADKNMRLKKKERLISYSAHLDTCIYQRYAFVLNQLYNAFAATHHLDQVAVAYRDNLHLAPYELANRAFCFMQEKQHCFVMVGDFSNFFDKLDHKYLKQQLCALLGVESLPADWYAVYKQITRYGKCDLQVLVKARGLEGNKERVLKQLNRARQVVSKEQFMALKNTFTRNKDTKGVPQGSPISAVLANVYMMDYDLEFSSFAQAHGGLYMRYSDDTILVLPLGDQQAPAEYIEAVKQILKKYEGLVELQLSKTKQYEYQAGKVLPLSDNSNSFMDYLGMRLDAQGIKIKPKCFTKYYYRLVHKARVNRRQQIIKSRKQQGITSNAKLYKLYGKKHGERNLLSYLRRVHRAVDLAKDPEAMALLQGDVKGKVRRALKK